MHNEHQRLSAVNRFKFMNAGVDHDLNSMANLVAQICEAPIGLVTIIDESTQWFKAKQGLDIECGAREQGFCNITIEQNGLLIIPDTTADERYNQLPVVVNDPHVRFYAGAPLTTYDGYNVGTVCVLDVVPRELTMAQQEALRTIAKQVTNILELNWSLGSLTEQHAECERQRVEIEQYNMKLKAVFNGSKDIHILVNKTFNLLAFNKAAEKHFLTFYQKHLVLGESLLNYLNPISANRLMVYFNSAMAGVSQQTEWMFDVHEQQYWLNVYLSAIYNERNEVTAVSVNATDITSSKQYEELVKQQEASLQRLTDLQTHELSQPVAILNEVVELLKKDAAFTNNNHVQVLSSAVEELTRKLKAAQISADAITNHKQALT